MTPRLVAGGILAITLALGAGDAAAASGMIVRVRSADPSLDDRLDAELATLGFTVKPVDGAEPGTDLGEIARANGAVAALRVDPGDAVELWVEGRAPGDPPVRETIPADPRRRGVAAVLALEALRAHLLQVQPGPANEPPRTSEPPPPSPPSPVPSARRWLWLQLAAGVDASPGGIAPAPELLFALRLEPRPWLSLGAFGAVTPLAARLDAPEGGALLRRAIVGAGIDLQKEFSRTTLAIGAGGALVLLFVEGTSPAAGYRARDAFTVTAGPLLRASASTALASSVRVRADLAAGATFPRTTITFADREGATWGRPFGLLTLGLEWGPL